MEQNSEQLCEKNNERVVIVKVIVVYIVLLSLMLIVVIQMFEVFICEYVFVYTETLDDDGDLSIKMTRAFICVGDLVVVVVLAFVYF